MVLEMKMDLNSISKLLEEVSNDNTVPRNIRNSVDDLKKNIHDEKQDIAIRINHTISVLDDISNDPNMPIYARTQIWNIVSMLEVINNELKG